MSFTVSLQQRIQQLKKAQADLPEILYQAQVKAAQAAVDAATDATPPNAGRGQAGVNMLTGELKQHWVTDSEVIPDITANSLTSTLANDVGYASYVDQGHRLDKHFVPGLYVDESGVLNRDLSKNVGLVVGPKTRFVKGEFMADKGKAAYEEILLKELDGVIKKVMA